MVHLKSRPHTCDLCGKSFAARAGMENHIALIHEKQQPFACDRYTTLGWVRLSQVRLG